MKRSNLIQGPELSLKQRVSGFLLRIGKFKLLKKLENQWPPTLEDQIKLVEDVLKEVTYE